MFYLAHMTSVAVAIFLSVMLKVLVMFHFIDWRPVGFLMKTGRKEWVSYVLLAVLLYLLAFVLYSVTQSLLLVPPFWLSLILGGVTAIVVEWYVLKLPAEVTSFRKLSIPFIVTLVLTFRFIVETATFHFASRQKMKHLPYKATMVK